jgi:hypothetical protein
MDTRHVFPMAEGPSKPQRTDVMVGGREQKRGAISDGTPFRVEMAPLRGLISNFVTRTARSVVSRFTGLAVI